MINLKMKPSVEEDVFWVKIWDSLIKPASQLQEMLGQGLWAIKAAPFAGYFLILSMTA